MELVFASHNKHKLQEIVQLLDHSIILRSLDDIGFFTEIEESGNTLAENASIKSSAIYHATKYNCFADDTGLEVSALNDAPGVHSARYAGNEKDSKKNIDLLLHNLKDKDKRDARFVTCISLIIHGKEAFFEGELKGEIIKERRGTNGFGYDPVFIPEGYAKTLAELSLDEKNKISHRARAFALLRKHLEDISS